jgi:ketosteroid isomerase-like protein
MSQKIELIRDACAAWGTGDISIYGEMYASDATAYAGRLAPEITGELRGPDEIIAVLQSLLETFEHSELVPESFFERGDAVVVGMLMRAKPRGASGTIEWRLWVTYRFRANRIVHQAWYEAKGEALEAAARSD